MSQKTGFFSLKRNLRILFSPQPGQLRPVDGLRAISILLVLILHSFWFLTIFDPGATAFFYTSPAWLNAVYNGELGVDVFFVISGFLISCLLMEEYRKNGEVRFLRFYQRRFFRLMPAYLAAIALGLLMLPENQEYVWTNLLYINNLMPAETHFMPWTWSLAIEEQFYFLYPLLLVLALRFVPPKAFIWLATLLFVGSLVIRYGVIQHYQLSLPYCWYIDCENFHDVINHIYVKPWTRFGSFLPGIYAAYLHVYHRDSLEALFARRSRALSLWTLLALAIALTILFIPVNNQYASFPDSIGTIFYAAYRNLFTSAVGFVLLASLYSRSGTGLIAARVLSLRFFYPIGQLAYSSYLFHPFVFVIIYGVLYQSAAAMPLAQKIGIVMAVGIPVTLLVAMVIYLFIERPFMNMRSKLAKKPQLQKESGSYIIEN